LSPALPAEIPSIEETRYNRASIVDALSKDIRLPTMAVVAGALQADVIEPDILAVLRRAQSEDLSWPDERLLFRGLHILGGRRLPAAYRLLVAFLRGKQDRVEALFGDAITETLPRILAGLFDGDEEPLRTLIADTRVDPFVREAALKALGFLAFEGRIDRAGFEAFLRRFETDGLASPDDEVMWHAWMTAVGVLGMTALAPQVHAAFADGRISPMFCDENFFAKLLEVAVVRPDDRQRLDDEQMGYIYDVLATLEQSPERDTDDRMSRQNLLRWAADDMPNWLSEGLPACNPNRGVGRNDPCPCGSGKKYKKCCLG
jgi:hypothetical protein